MKKALCLVPLLAALACRPDQPDPDDVMRQVAAEQQRFHDRGPDDAAPKPPPPRPAPRQHTFEWSADGTQFHDRDVPTMRGAVEVRDGTYTLQLEGFPEETRWQVGDQTGGCVVACARIRVADLMPKVGDLPVTEQRAKLDPDAVLTLHLPDGDARLPLPPITVDISTITSRQPGWPLRYGDEPDRTGPIRSIAFYGVIGRARTRRDIDAVVHIHKLTEVKGHRTCYARSAGAGSLIVDFVDTQVDVTDRRTGKVVKSKVFPPVKSCPEYAFFSDDDEHAPSSDPIDQIRAWLKTQIGK